MMQSRRRDSRQSASQHAVPQPRHIPQEVCDMIVKFAVKGPNANNQPSQAFKACAQVCKSWIPGSRSVGFGTVNAPLSLNQGEALINLLNTGSGRYVVNLPLLLRQDPTGEDPGAWDNLAPLTRAIPRLDRVQTLELGEFVWSESPPDFRSAIVSLLQSGRVTQLTLSSINLDNVDKFIEFISCCESVVDLTIDRLYADDRQAQPCTDPGMDTPTRPRSRRLRSLKLSGVLFESPFLLDWLLLNVLCPFDLSRIRTFELPIRTTPKEIARIDTLLQRIGTSLRTLIIPVPYDPEMQCSYKRVNIMSNTGLRTIEFKLIEEDGLFDPKWITIMLMHTVPPGFAIEELNFVIPVGRRKTLTMNQVCCSAFDHFLLRGGRFPSLKRIHFHTRVLREEDPRAVYAKVAAAFPGMAQRRDGIRTSTEVLDEVAFAGRI